MSYQNWQFVFLFADAYLLKMLVSEDTVVMLQLGIQSKAMPMDRTLHFLIANQQWGTTYIEWGNEVKRRVPASELLQKLSFLRVVVNSTRYVSKCHRETKGDKKNSLKLQNHCTFQSSKSTVRFSIVINMFDYVNSSILVK